ncbi:SpoIID/LytB domain-containing protein [Paenibacillus silvisoli]|uniref:SpoIID/LytB domain-containing protein n=1 Tax=Paenibacillus silvisoli TaxID=3110539 RepID=UPI0028057B21|nr:SpoIID/LytB domain-containing protein [Paenibacillus silvisoli]
MKGMNAVQANEAKAPRAQETKRARLPKAVRTMTVLITGVMALSVWTSVPSSGAAVPKLDSIRVAIFINTSKYKLETGAATFSAAGALQVGVRQPSGVIPLFQTSPGETVRFSLDDYKPLLLETTDYMTALSAVKRLKAMGASGMMTASSDPRGKLYQIAEGSYASAAEAKAAGDRWLKDSTLAGLAGKSGGTGMIGPLHLDTDLIFASKAEALSAAQTYSAAGVEAYAAIKQNGSAPGVYTVVVGAESDQTALGKAKAQAQQINGALTLRQTDADASYILIRDDYTTNESASKPAATLYSIPAAGTKLWLSTDAPTGIKLMERYNRSYRGQFEVSGLNNKLAVVNELPFEQYLYAVVGAEMPSSWPAEALKSQAVAARTYALYQGFGFQIAHVVDTTLSQAYGGIGSEKPATIAAVDATSGEVAMYNGKVIETVFSSSAGGASADSKEIWGSDVAYLKSVESPDSSSEKGLYRWYRIVLPNGSVGYMREDLLDATDQTSATGQPILRVNADGAKVRPIPLIQDNVPVVDQANRGTLVVQLEKVTQSNEMSWVRGTYSSADLLTMMNGKLQKPVSGSISTLEVSQKGPSGRPIELLANGQKLQVKYPDLFRSAFGGLPSTFFSIDETARMTIAGGGGAIRNRPTASDSGPFYLIGSDGSARELKEKNVFILNGDGELRAATKEPGFRFIGSGNGHGVGLSQYGARGLAELGYDYKYIMQYYYKDVTIVKE